MSSGVKRRRRTKQRKKEENITTHVLGSYPKRERCAVSDPHSLPGWTGSSRPRTPREATASRARRGAAAWSGVRLRLLLFLLPLLLLFLPLFFSHCLSKVMQGTSPTPSIRSRTTWARGRGRAEEGGGEEEEVEVEVGSDSDASFDAIFVLLSLSLERSLRALSSPEERPFCLDHHRKVKNKERVNEQKRREKERVV